MKPFINKETLLPEPETDATPMNLRARLKMAHFDPEEEIDFARPKFLRVDYVKACITEIAAGLLLFAGFASLIALILLSLN